MKYLKITLFTLFFSALLCLSALAAGEADSQNSGMDELTVTDGTTITVKNAGNGTVTPDDYGVYPNSEKYTVTYSGAVAGNDYVIFVLKGNSTAAVPTEDNILYIDQVKADENGVVTFEVYPMNVTSGGKIYITDYTPDATGLLMLGSYVYYAPYTLGDVNDDTDVDSVDALLTLKIAAKLETATQKQFLAADVTKDNVVDSVDALNILKYAAKLITTW